MEGALGYPASNSAALSQDPVGIASDILKLAASGLFDAGFYLAAHPDVAASGYDPLVHFCDVGWRRGYSPNACFDVAAYLAANPDAEAAGVNPLVHYLNAGEAEGQPALPRFDPGWYRARYQPAAEVRALADFLRRQAMEWVNPNPGFDAAWYAAEYAGAFSNALPLFSEFVLVGAAAGREPSPEAKVIRAAAAVDETFYRTRYPGAAAADPVHDYCMMGWRAGRDPSPDFDTGYYLSTYADVAAAGQNPLAHYVQFGRAEGRLAKPDPAAPAVVQPAEPSRAEPAEPAVAALFDENYYLINYPDVRESSFGPFEHFMQFGFREGRRANAYFDAHWYGAAYLPHAPDTNPLLHYTTIGERLGNRPTAYFDPAWYRQHYALPDDISPLAHFLTNRRSQRVSPVPEFDVEAYVAAFGAAIGPNRDPFAHYLRVATTRDIDPGPGFDARKYRLEYLPPAGRLRAVEGNEIEEKRRREALNPLVHYLLRRHAPVALDAAAAS